MGVIYQMSRLLALVWFASMIGLALCGDYDGVADWAQPYPTNTTTGWYHYYGDYRASVRVDEDLDAVQVKLVWRRRDPNPTNCSVQVIFPYELGQAPIQNVVLKETSRESTIVVFQPLYGPGEYHIYYMPYEGEGGTGLWVQVDYDPYFVTAENDWMQTYVNNNAYKTLPSATFVQFQSRTSFGRYTSMEFIALQSEVDSIIAKSQGAPYVLFPENRKNPLKMREFLPMRWGQQGSSTQFSGTARQGEFYVFQIGVFAITQNITINNVTFQDLKDPKGAVLVPGKTFKCWNFGGIDYLGNPFSQTWTVPQGTVNSIWCGFQIPDSAVKGQTYTTTAKVNVVPSSTVKVSVTISQSDALANKGQDDIWRLSRLEWLDSTLGRDDSPVPPYTPLQVDNGVIYILGKKILIGDTGFTESIGVNGNSITNGPIQLDTFAGGNQLEWNIIQSTTFEYATPTSARWNATIRTFDGSIQAVVRAECSFDGYVNYSISITALKNILLDDIQLSASISDYASLYMAGMGYQGGYRSRQGALAWNWIPGDSSNMVWFGNFDAGIRIKLKGTGAAWEGPYFMYDNIPDSWANGGLGGCVIDNEPTMVAYSGTRNMTKGMTVIFNYDLMMTPVKPLDNDHWNQRYYQMGYPGNDYHGIDEVKNVGATIVNVHQGVNSWINPNINYPFRPLVVDTLANYSQWGKDEGIKVKFYYTVRELSNYAEELWALRTLGNEIYLGGDGHGPAGGSQGSHWIREHIEEDYQACWQTVMANGDFDAAICDSGVGRWVNFYIEGLKASVEDPVGIDGVYCDGIAFPRDTMLRVRRVLNNIRPGTKKLIDLHSGDMFISWGNAMTAASYMHLFPFIDSLWFGEMFNYSQSYDYWLVAVAGIPYGLYGEILGEGNPWYGMVFGMTQRYLPGWIDPTPMWQFWDYFGINSSELVGWWDPNCPVTTTDENVKASVYQKSNEALIAIGNWNTKDVQVELYIDWGALGFDKTKCVLVAEAISGFQDQNIFLPDQLIPTEAQQGWVLIVRAASTTQELELIQSRT